MLEHLGKAGDAARGQSVHRPGADAIDANFLGPKIVGQIARARFERRLGDPHDIVVGHDLFRAVVGHGDNASALGHQRRSGVGKRDERVSAHVVRHAECLAAGVHKIAFERLFRREGDGVQQQMQPAEFLARFVEHARDVIVLRHITFHQQRVCAERAGEFLDIFLEPLALVGEGQFGARLVPCLGNSPGDGALVGDTEDDAVFSSE